MKRNAIFLFLILVATAGCSTSSSRDSNVTLYRFIAPEPDWIRNGEPIEFEGELWYPRDVVDILTDAEVMPLGEYRGIPYYLQTIDIRPFERLYTKFGKNKYRVFETKLSHDTSQRAF